ncbi:MAG: M23 family metallopeptidase [Anaerolineales bacterium]
MVISIACNFPSAQQNQGGTLSDDRLQTLVPRLQASAMVDQQTPVSGANAPTRAQATLQTTASPPEEIAPYSRSSSGDQFIFPDSEVIYSPSVAGFDIEAFVTEAGGFLSSYSAIVDDELMSGIEIVDRVAIDNSTNPRLILALLEFRSKWVYQPQPDPNSINYPLGLYVPGQVGLYKELTLVAKLLNMGYYGWRSGDLEKIAFLDRQELVLDFELNAGSAALLYLFSRLYNYTDFETALRGNDNFLLLHQDMFGDPWERAEGVDPILPEDLVQPDLVLPFLPGEPWSFTGGPHSSWGTGTPRGALDFAPVTGEPECAVSRAWVTASAPGVVARSERNLLALDLDGDGFEGTGWVLIYYHLADKDRLSLGSRVELDDPLGHPSCEGGQSTGTHVHIARKYNGEWLPANEDYPFVLSGWKVVEGTRAYEGFLVKDDVVITANPGGSRISIITR